ncbi:glycoside hydrolase family 9 protein [Pontibacter silvestris]|uniref:Endoglucanase n=1 Tax=Pontibacter silvestris TaxID=2305183 RepID=A0ABW4WZ05_9BACT|nr:glycoside hydrolase family 9 protein [Pontibacter silvestris]MCC9137610.1 glycoside hydrolase family 9 protein [Pontibacter silvestris]
MQTFYKALCGMLLCSSLVSCSNVQQESDSNVTELSENIRLNQVGFYPNAPKVAVVVGEQEGGAFYLKTPDLNETVFTGKLAETKAGEFSKRPTRVADFSEFNKAGAYVIEVPGVGHSYPFVIEENVHHDVAAAAIKGFYYQRVSTDLPEEYAGKWHRKAGHEKEDNHVLVHTSAATAQRPAGTVLSAPRGWYDAGDYNKYIVNSGITMGTLLSAYEDFPGYYKTLELNIPESGNPVPDLLDEVLWNLRWMLTMQDPSDGGVYHKLTNPAFDGMVMPAEAKNTRYVVQKGTGATLDFAAVMAQASRVYKNYNKKFPGLADSCLMAATKAWEWAQKNPDVVYDQDAMNKQFDPDITTGAYGDNDFSDEFTWAAAELYVTTNKDSYYTAVNMFPDEKMPLPSWGNVRLLGYYTLARHQDKLSPVAKKDFPKLQKRLVAFADNLMEGASDRSYRTVMGKSESDYIWGSSSVAANQGIALLQAYRLTSDKKYVQAALNNLDYLLGRNATGYSFVTGYGEKSTMNPHHRPSVADGIKEPVPGLLSGGTNAQANRQDNCATYTSEFADEMYTDDDCSYASNEIAINWNAPLVYLVGAIEALQQKAGLAGMIK